MADATTQAMQKGLGASPLGNKAVTFCEKSGLTQQSATGRRKTRKEESLGQRQTRMR